MEMNLLDDDGRLERTWPPERPGYVWRRKRIAGEHLGAGLIQLPPGESTFPYHYELGNDELLVVVTGRPTLRRPDGDRQLAVGDCILFRSGPEGAHKITNRSGEIARVLLVSSFALPRAAVQVDSNKMMVRWGRNTDERSGSSSATRPATGTARPPSSQPPRAPGQTSCARHRLTRIRHTAGTHSSWISR